MEYITKKEFFQNYASKKWKSLAFIGPAAASVCVLLYLVHMANTSRSGLLLPVLFPKYFYPLFFVECFLYLGLALTAQRAYSRVCAALLLVYSSLSSIILLGGEMIRPDDNMPYVGWAMIIAAALTVRGVFGLHKEYERRFQDGALPASDAEGAPEVWQAQEEKRGRKSDDLTRKEFFAQYAGKQAKGSVKKALILFCVCMAVNMAVSIAAALLTREAAPALAYALTYAILGGLLLGAAKAYSRVCAALLLTYSLISSYFGTMLEMSEGRISFVGWALVYAAVLAVRGTFSMHREYQAFLKDNILPVAAEVPAQESRGTSAEESKKRSWELLATMAPFVGMFLGLCVIYLSICPTFLEMFIASDRTPEALLRGYGNWYRAIIVFSLIAVLLPLAGIIISVWKGSLMRQSAMLMVLSLLGINLVGGMLIGEDIPGLIVQIKEDLTQIESGELREDAVWLHSKSRAAQMPGLYSADYPELFMHYRGNSVETDEGWVSFYVPDSLGFSPDLSAPYKESKSVQWNEENARQYQILYTDNLRVVVSIEPVP